MNYTSSTNEVFMGNRSDNESDAEILTDFYQQYETYIVPPVFGIIFFIGTIGNSLIILIFINHPSIRSVPNR